jgi:ribosome-associated heat shock protein Hsp15
MTKSRPAGQASNPPKVRLDKWLWAARFFKTRSLAKQAIEGGKVHYDGARSRVSKEVGIGANLRIRRGEQEMTVEVSGLSAQRGPASEACKLYSETPESKAAREQHEAQRRAANAGIDHPAGRPDKRDRRMIHRFKNRNNDG